MSLNLQDNSPYNKFINTTNMLHSNKINKDNAFDNRLVEHIDDIFKQVEREYTKETLWQKYSTGIDNCTKVFGFCVDQVYSDTYKVLSGINRAQHIEQAETENSEEDGDGEENSDGEQEKKPKKRPTASMTLVKSEDEINTDKFETSEALDPGFTHISSMFDAASTKTSLICVLDCQTEVFDYKFETGLNFESNETEPAPEVFGEELRPKAEFERKGYHPRLLSLCDGINEGSSQLAHQLQLFGPLRKPDEEEEPFEEDEEDETGFCDETEDYMTSRLERSAIKGEFSVNRNLVDRITSLVDFDNFNHFTNKTSQWAGSDFIQTRLMPNNRSTSQRQRRSNNDEEFKFDPLETYKAEEIFKPGKNLSLTERQLEAKRNASFQLPDDYQFYLEKFQRLFNRSGSKIRFNGVTQVETNSPNQAVEDTIFDIPEEANEDDDYLDSFMPYDEGADDFKDITDRLNYARNSKAIDIKKLKENMWGCIDKENNQSGQAPSSFMGILDDMSHNSRQDTENLSVHSCFVAMLHLAHENELELVQQVDGCDFRINFG